MNQNSSKQPRVASWAAMPGLLILTLSLTGCPSNPTLQEIEKFGVASKSLATDTVAGIDLINNVVIERNIYMRARNDQAPTPLDTDFDGILVGDAYTFRVRAVQQLGAYADGLKELAAADVATEVTNAATKLDESLNGLAATIASTESDAAKRAQITSEAQAAVGLISAAISAIGQQVVEKKKREAIKTVIIEAHPFVKKVGELVAYEFEANVDPTDPNRSLLAFNVQKSIGHQKTSLKEAYDSSRSTLTFEKRLAALAAIREKHDESTTAMGFFRKVSQGSAEMVAAHTTLFDAVSENKFSTEEVVQAVSALISTVSSLKEKVNNLDEA